MNFGKHFIAGLVVTAMLALAPNTLLARGGGGGGGHYAGGGGHFAGGGHFGGFHGGFGSRGFGAVGHGFHGYWDGGYYAPFDYGFDGYDGYAYPYDGNDYSFDAQPAPSDSGSDASASLIVSVQRELTRLGYYKGPIDGVAGSETEHAVRWFQSVDHLPVTGQIDAATLQALHIA